MLRSVTVAPYIVRLIGSVLSRICPFHHRFIGIQLQPITGGKIFIVNIRVISICIILVGCSGVIYQCGGKAEQAVICTQRTDRKDQITICMVDISCPGKSGTVSRTRPIRFNALHITVIDYQSGGIRRGVG